MKLLASINPDFLFKHFLIACVFCFTDCFAKGDLTRQKPIELEIFLKGKVGESHYYDPSILKFETGKLYKLKLINTSDSKHYFSSNKFTNSIFTRKVQIVKNKKKVVEIKGKINEVEVFPGNTVEWWFVPIKTGEFKDLYCGVKDKKTDISHSEMGMTGTIIIE